jgi:hypothetical protein
MTMTEAEAAARRARSKAKKMAREEGAAALLTGDYEAETLARAAAGDRAARREALALAADATRRGLPLSVALRAWLADALVALLAAVEADAPDLANALAPLGFERNPAHRPPDDGAHLRRLEIVAAVHVLATLPGVGKSAAVTYVAQALPASDWKVWRDCKDVEGWPDIAAAQRAAVPVLDRIRALIAREPLACCSEVRDFLKATDEE